MRIVVVGGGTATNAITSVFTELAEGITYVVPISDNGGSTSEILRVFGGPAIGDARSRLVRLIDPSPLRTLLAMRLSKDPEIASIDWNLVVDGTHEVWNGVRPYMKAMYRSFLVEVHSELLKRTTTMHKFDFSSASIGNLLLTGARLFFGTLESAIEFVLHTNRVPSHLNVLPCLNSRFSYHIAAKLEDGNVVVGQSQISHPSHHLSAVNDDDGQLFSHPSLRMSQINFQKDVTEPLPSKIDSVYYINPYGDEIRPKPSARVVEHLKKCDALVISVGSLYTSLIPVLILQGFAQSIPSKCILMLNGSQDRETEGMSPVDYLEAIQRAFKYSGATNANLVTDIIYPHTLDSICSIEHINCVPALCIDGMYHHESLIDALKKCLSFVT